MNLSNVMWCGVSTRIPVLPNVTCIFIICTLIAYQLKVKMGNMAINNRLPSFDYMIDALLFHFMNL